MVAAGATRPPTLSVSESLVPVATCSARVAAHRFPGTLALAVVVLAALAVVREAAAAARAVATDALGVANVADAARPTVPAVTGVRRPGVIPAGGALILGVVLVLTISLLQLSYPQCRSTLWCFFISSRPVLLRGLAT